MSLLSHGTRGFIVLLAIGSTAMSDTVLPKRIPSPGGEVAITSPRDQEF
jgi:hypothetical protein